jgi:hypothetical protein
MMSIDINTSIRLDMELSEKFQDMGMQRTSAFKSNSRAINTSLYGLINRTEIHCGHQPVGVSILS